MNDTELLQRLHQILDRTSGNVNDDKEDAIEALLDYVNNDEVRELYERISE